MGGISQTFRNATLTLAIWFAAAVLCPDPSLADGADTQRVEERLPAPVRPLPESTAPANVKTAPDTQIDMAAFPAFTLRWVAIEGTSAPEATEACTQKFIGKTVGPIELSELTQCITQLYRSRGFFLSRAIVPPQEIQDGALKVKVIEGYIAAIAPTGMSETDARAQFAVVLNERPAKLQTFERALLLLADRYGYRVTASQLAADPQDPARFTFNLGVTVARFSLRFFGDNRGTDAHGPDEAYGSVAWNAVFGNDRAAVSIFTVPSSPDELLYGEFNYASMWLSGDLSTDVGASFSKTQDGEMPSSLAADGDAQRYYARASVPLLRSRAQSLWIAALFEVRETRENDPVAPDTREHTRILRGTVNYNVTDAGGRNDLSLEVSKGLDAFGASHNGDPCLTRPDGRPQFAKLRIDASRLQKLGEGLDVLFSVSGQLSDGALVGAEEFGGGGARFGRAYNYSEITGDEGAAGAVELRYTLQQVFGVLPSLQLYAFADAATIWNEGAEESLSSTGLGLRLAPVAGVSASVEIAKPLSREVAEEGNRNLRAFFSLSAGW